MRFEKFETPSIFPEEEKSEAKERQKFELEMVSPDTRKFSDYFENYPQPEVTKYYWDNIRNLNKDGIFLYKTKDVETQEERLNHIIWIYRKSETYLNRPISEEDWIRLKENPEVIDKINKNIIESLNQALDFYDWKVKPQGFLIEESQHFGMEVGNIHGIRVSFQTIKPLLEAFQKRDTKEIEKQKKYIASSIVHELTHRERNDGLVSTVRSEIASHIVQFCFDPKENEVFNKQLDQSLVNIEKTRRTQEPLNLYDKAQYSALLLIVKKLGEKNEFIHTALEKDKDPSKLIVLKQLREFIEERDIEWMREELVREFIKKEGNELWKMVIKTEKDLRIEDKITERK